MADPVVIERIIDASPDEAFDLLTRPERLRRWQALSASIDLRVGGEYRLTVVPGGIAEGTVTELDPGRRIRLSWGWNGSDDVPPGSSDLLIELEPHVDGTLVRFSHAGLDGEVELGERSMPAEYKAGVLALELFIHGWDFAQAIGEPFEAPEHLSDYIRSIADATIQPDFRGEGKGFAAEQITVTEDPIDRLMAFTGRVPMPSN